MSTFGDEYVEVVAAGGVKKHSIGPITTYGGSGYRAGNDGSGDPPGRGGPPGGGSPPGPPGPGLGLCKN
jgi:hypothetical protein